MTPLEAPAPAAMGEWLTVKEAAERAKCSTDLIYDNIKRGRLRAARLGYSTTYRIRDSWLEEWLVASATPHEIATDPAAGGPIPFKRRGRKPHK